MKPKKKEGGGKRQAASQKDGWKGVTRQSVMCEVVSAKKGRDSENGRVVYQAGEAEPGTGGNRGGTITCVFNESKEVENYASWSWSKKEGTGGKRREIQKGQEEKKKITVEGLC